MSDREQTSAEAPPRLVQPRIDVQRRYRRDGVVVIDEPFTVAVGLGERRMRQVLGPALGIEIPAHGDVILDVRVMYDPDSLHIEEPTRFTITVTDANPYPAETLTVTALPGDDLDDVRRIGVYYLLDGQTIGVAWRSIVAVADAADTDDAVQPTPRESALLELSPLSGPDAPDLVVAVWRADDSSANTRFVWAAYPRDQSVEVPDEPKTISLSGNLPLQANSLRMMIQYPPEQPQVVFDTLSGTGVRLGQSIPSAIRDVICAVIANARPGAPSILLMTEELYLPWELATFGQGGRLLNGGDDAVAPFLGAHAAIGRWLIAEGKPKPVLRTTVDARRLAVVTGDYSGVPRYPPLPHATAEAEQLGAAYPPCAPVPAEYEQVRALFNGSPEADVIHVAVHGLFDEQGTEEGLVLITTKGDQKSAAYLRPESIETLTLSTHPFVFLNACQLGADKWSLGSYGGLAATFLKVGASGVIACIWNIDDDVAGDVAVEFYRRTYDTVTPISVGEYLRQVRARYTRAAVLAGAEGVSATLVAYQLLGHPRLRLRRD